MALTNIFVFFAVKRKHISEEKDFSRNLWMQTLGRVSCSYSCEDKNRQYPTHKSLPDNNVTTSNFFQLFPKLFSWMCTAVQVYNCTNLQVDKCTIVVIVEPYNSTRVSQILILLGVIHFLLWTRVEDSCLDSYKWKKTAELQSRLNPAEFWTFQSKYFGCLHKCSHQDSAFSLIS